MAIIFTSPRKEQRMLFWLLSCFTVFVLAAVFLMAFPVELQKKTVSPGDVSIPEIQVNTDILHSEQIKDLEIFNSQTSSVEDVGRKDPFLPY